MRQTPPMTYDPAQHHRRSIRLRGYDYTQPGLYFITICAYRHTHLFGRVVDGTMQLNACGRIVAEEWHRTAVVRSNVAVDAFVVMPNHVHGIIAIVEPDASRDTPPVCPYESPVMHPDETPVVHPHEPPGRSRERAFGTAVPESVSTIMRQYKSIVTKRINRLRGTPGGPVWQRNYYEHIIRNERALTRIRRYIADNPRRWHGDRYHSNQ